MLHSFPSQGDDDWSDAMLVVETKETGEALLAKLLQRLDVFAYEPLRAFVDTDSCIRLSLPFVRTLQRAFRRHWLLKQRTKLLFKFFSPEMLKVNYL